MDVHAHDLDGRGDFIQQSPAARDGGPRAFSDGDYQLWLSPLHVADVEPLPTNLPGSAGWSRPQSTFARSRDGRSSADALHGLRRILRRFRVCDLSFDRWKARCDLGALEDSLDRKS